MQVIFCQAQSLCSRAWTMNLFSSDSPMAAAASSSFKTHPGANFVSVCALCAQWWLLKTPSGWGIVQPKRDTLGYLNCRWTKTWKKMNYSWVDFCFCWSRVGSSCVSGIMIDLSEKQRVFPSPQCSEQSRVFVFPGRAPSSASGIVHVLHGGRLLTQECGATSCAVYCF